MKIALDTKGTLAGFKEALDTAMRDDQVQGLLVLSCADNNFTPGELDPLLADIPMPVLGGCFPGIVCEEQVYERGTLAIALPVRPKVQVIENLSRDRDNFYDVIDTSVFDHLSEGTMVILVDGMSFHVNALLEEVFNDIGLVVGYIGGGAASVALVQQPCLITNEGLKEDCAILAHLALNSGIGVAHGMTSVGGPYRVTGAVANMITTIDWQPAAPFYKERVLKHPDSRLKKQSFIGTDAHYSLGLNRYDSERVIVEPIKIGPDNSLGFMMGMREGAFVDIMHITEDTMIQSAATAVTSAIDALESSTGPQTLVTFDCVSRKIFLDNRFGEELEAISSPGISCVGALTCGGEIGTSGSDFLDYHNRTCVVAVFEE